MILPKKDSEAKNGDVKPTPEIKQCGVKLPASTSTPDMKSLQIGVKIPTAEPYTFSQNFKCPPTELYNVLTLPELVRAFTNAPTQVDASVGGKFSLFDGQITGQFTKLVRRKVKSSFTSLVPNIVMFSFRSRTKPLSRSGGSKHGRKGTIQRSPSSCKTRATQRNFRSFRAAFHPGNHLGIVL